MHSWSGILVCHHLYFQNAVKTTRIGIGECIIAYGRQSIWANGANIPVHIVGMANIPVHIVDIGLDVAWMRPTSSQVTILERK